MKTNVYHDTHAWVHAHIHIFGRIGCCFNVLGLRVHTAVRQLCMVYDRNKYRGGGKWWSVGVRRKLQEEEGMEGEALYRALKCYFLARVTWYEQGADHVGTNQRTLKGYTRSDRPSSLISLSLSLSGKSVSNILVFSIREACLGSTDVHVAVKHTLYATYKQQGPKWKGVNLQSWKKKYMECKCKYNKYIFYMWQILFGTCPKWRCGIAQRCNEQSNSIRSASSSSHEPRRYVWDSIPATFSYTTHSITHLLIHYLGENNRQSTRETNQPFVCIVHDNRLRDGQLNSRFVVRMYNYDEKGS